MPYSTEIYGAGCILDSIHSELNFMEVCYKEYLQEEELAAEMTMLRQCVEDCMQGSPEAAECLLEFGDDIITDIKSRLDVLSTEHARMVEESPAATEATGRRAHEANQASVIASATQSKLSNAIAEIHG